MGQRKTPACWPGASGALSEQLPSIDFLTTLPYVNPDRIGGMGICADGGYTVNAAINDRRIKAVGTVSAVNIGSMFRNGGTTISRMRMRFLRSKTEQRSVAPKRAALLP